VAVTVRMISSLGLAYILLPVPGNISQSLGLAANTVHCAIRSGESGIIAEVSEDSFTLLPRPSKGFFFSDIQILYV
jgi:hypothetical protein